VILVDTSIWIELRPEILEQHSATDKLVDFATCGPVLQEVLQGWRPETNGFDFTEALLALPRLSDPLPLATFLEAAEIFRLGRRKGYTIRSSVDCLIAAIAIENRVPVWHRDRDFAQIARYTALEAVEDLP
jgi:predicted nucleic acid-binding protein